ncbi:hypothetical protein ABGB17_06990 [Sphaerisporangium sp. B11E5]|uniref:hypothetical protein n=1 Tax=Sphaerisporangium sp. B11E5 TaxID=3153563 RepID=UPI00325F3730
MPVPIRLGGQDRKVATMLDSPLYVNMTRWGALYGGPGGNWGPGRVDPAADQVENQLGLGPGGLPRLLPASNTSDDLDYILPATRVNLGLPNPLFAAAVGSQHGGAGNNGRVVLDDLRGAMNSVWPVLANPCYAIIDSDAAHHVSLLLAELAFANVAAGRAKIVINFDAHTDYSVAAMNAASLRCDNWGSFVIRPVGAWVPIADAYVMIGNKAGGGQAPNPAWSNTTCRLRAPNTQSQNLAGATVRLQMQSLVNLLNANIAHLNGNAPWAGYDVYVTVDRDFQQQSFTDYGDGAYTTVAAWQAVHDCMDELNNNVPNVAFAGFDICGLPTYAGASVAAGALAPQQRFNLALQDIQTFENEIAAL